MKDPIYLNAHANGQQELLAPVPSGPGLYTTQQLPFPVVTQESHAGSFANGAFTAPRDARLLVVAKAASIADSNDDRKPVSLTITVNYGWKTFAPNNAGQPVSDVIEVKKGDQLRVQAAVAQYTVIAAESAYTSLSITELLQ